jgi:hypothetical protein
MSTGLLSQLDTYYSWIDEAQNPIHPDEVASLIDTPMRELAVSVPANPRRGWLTAVAAAATVLVLVGGAALLLRVTGSDTPVAGTVVPTTVADSTPSTVAEQEVTVTDSTPTTVAEQEVLIPGSWSRVPPDEAVFGGGSSLSSVTVGGPGLVAVGRDEGMVLTSVDGITWSRVPYDEVVFGGSTMNSVAAGGPGLVAVGWVGQAVDAFDGDRATAVWTSVDGVTWSRVPHDEAALGGAGGQWMNSVTVGGPGLVAVGSVVNDGDDAAAVWTSVDGITWSRVPHDEAVFGGVGGQWMSSVTVGGPGLVAVGGDQPGDDVPSGRAQDAAVWTSVDGVTWSRVPHDVTLFGGTGNQRMYQVTAAGAGLVAVGADGGFYATRPDAVVWTSVDGVTWSRVPHDEAVFGGAEMHSVTVAGAGLVAVGDKSSAGGPEAIESGDSVFVWVAEPDD